MSRFPRPGLVPFHPLVRGLVASTLIFIVGAQAQATVTISSITGASNIDEMTSQNPIVYGGMAGSCATTDENSTCDSCAGIAPAGDSGLVACNNERIHPDLLLRITFSSDKFDGHPVASTDEQSPSTITVESDTSVVATKGTATTVILRWRNVCNTVLGNTSCDPGTNTAAKTIRIGIASTNSGNDTVLNDSAADDWIKISIKVHKEIGQGNGATSLATRCTDTDPKGICFWEIGSDDEKAFIKDLQARAFLPGVNIPYRWVRMLYSTAGFADVSSSSPKIDLPLEGENSSTPTVSQKRIDGLENGLEYSFKLAIVDAAKNVGYFTASTEDSAYCVDPDAPAAGNCHVATPEPVVGILSKSQACFIATAAYGSPLAPEVETFRKFRNEVLLKTELGQRFVKFYYEHSPRYARIIAKSEVLRATSRAILWPLATYAHLSLSLGAGIATVIIFGGGLMAAALSLLLVILFVRHARMVRATEGETSRA